MPDPQTLLLLGMLAGLCLGLLSGFPVAFTLGGVPVLFAGLGWYIDAFELSYLAALPQRTYAAMNNEILLAVPLFVFMGAMLERSGIAANLLDQLGRLFGRMRGGLGCSITIVGAILAASTGVVGATVTTMALISLPVMLRWGYSPRLAAGSICAAGTLGQIIPPSIVLVLLADTISSAFQKAQFEKGVFAPETISIADLFMGAIGPSILLVVVYLLYQMALAVFRPTASPAPPAMEHGSAPALPVILFTLVPPLLLILAVLGSILMGIATPTEAASVGVAGALLISVGGQGGTVGRVALACALLALCLLFLRQSGILGLVFEAGKISWTVKSIYSVALTAIVLGLLLTISTSLVKNGVLLAALRETVTITGMIFGIVIAASILSLVFRGFDGDEHVAELLQSLPGGAYGMLLLTMLVIFLLGFILEFVEIIFIVVPIVGPIILQTDISPVWFAVLIALNLQTSFLTPPFGFALFYFRSVAPEDIRTSQIYVAVIPFVAIQLLALGLVAVFPALATWLPGVLF